MAAAPEPRPARSWPRPAPGVASLGLFALIAASLLFGTYLIFSTVQAERRERDQVARTALVIDALRDIAMAAVNAETGQRGYLISLDRRYLASYQLGAATYPGAVRRLHEQLDPAATRRQRALIALVEKLADAKFGEMAENVALVEDGRLLDAQQRLLTDEGQELMVELRAALGELEAIEARELAEAAADAARIEGRMLPLLGWLAALIVVALALGLGLVARTARAEAAAANARALAEARDRADLLAKELNHRVKNLFSMIAAIVQISGKGHPEAKAVIGKISERIRALVSAHEVTQGAGDHSHADLAALIAAALAPYRGEGRAPVIAGPRVALSAKQAIPIGLVLHELATNAVKYGALAAPEGSLEVRWDKPDRSVDLTWRESGLAPREPAGKAGFGSALMTSSARQLRGSIERNFRADGVEVRMKFPVD